MALPARKVSGAFEKRAHTLQSAIEPKAWETGWFYKKPRFWILWKNNLNVRYIKICSYYGYVFTVC